MYVLALPSQHGYDPAVSFPAPFQASHSRAIVSVFAITYLGVAAGHVPGLRVNRTGIALLGAIAIMVFSGIPTATLVGFVDWPTILLLFGFFVLSAQLRLAGFFERVAGGLAGRLDDPGRFLLTLMVVTACLSAFLNHDIVCVVFAPVVGTALLRKGITPVPFLCALAIASNIGAAATLVGNPQDMMIAQAAKLSFGPYLLWCIVPVTCALAAAYWIIRILSRRDLVPVTRQLPDPPPVVHPYDRAHTAKGLIVLAMAIALFFTGIPKDIIALTAAAIHLASPKFKTEDLLGLVDWPVLVLFISLFVVTGAFQSTGYGAEAMQALARAGVNLESPRILAVVAAGLSNMVNNSAAALLLVKLVNVTRPPLGYVLALANSFGGSLIVIGSVSNIIVVQQARELGVDISFRAFARLGIPVTLTAIAILLAWLAIVT
jgi:Na+/H+ antiporter NhaD/arsenite permease-like protein